MPKLQKYLDAINKNKKTAAGTAIGAGVLATPEDAEAGGGISKAMSLGLLVDNPSEKWAAGKAAKAERDIIENKGKGLGGKGLIGSVTGTFTNEGRTRFLDLPTDELVKLKGVEGEEAWRATGERHDKLKNNMLEKGYDKTKPVFININHKGEAYINEGNHRIAAAHAAGIKKIPVEIRYYNGGENAKGNFSPDKIYDMYNEQLAIKPPYEKGSATPKAIGTLAGLSLAGGAVAKGLSTIPQDVANYASDIAYNSPAGLIVEGANAYGKLGAGALGVGDEYQQYLGQYVDKFAEPKTEPFKKLDEAVGGAITKGFMTVENAVDYLKNNKGVNQMLGSVNPTPYQ